MLGLPLLLISCGVFLPVVAKNVDLKADVRINNVNREIDAASQLVKETQIVEIENTGSRPVSDYVIAIGPEHADHVSFVQAKKVGSEKPLKTEDAKVEAWSDNTKFYAVPLGGLRVGGKVSLSITIVYTHMLSPYPAKITQAENQHVVLEGSATLYSPYDVAAQKTTLKLASANVHSYTKGSTVTPSSQDAATITYGPYSSTPKFTWRPIRVHFENNSPFLTITKLTRLIEVSHWGNIAVEETIDVLHEGARLKGPFSRYDFQRDHRQSSPVVKSFRTLLPASASDVYYRDEIGNISTSHLREHDDSVEIDIRPRFPLFGGWKTHYVIGYNVPSYVYLFRRGKDFALKMRFIDLIFDNFVADEVETKIILPERTSGIKLSVPYPVEEKPRHKHYTYLDYTGRPVITAVKKNVVDNHIMDFTLAYKFDTATMIIEPMMIIAAFMALFVTVIFYVRLDFTIAKDATSEARLKVAGALDNIRSVVDDRSNVGDAFLEAIEQARTKKDLSILQSARKRHDQEVKRLAQLLSELTTQLRGENPEVAERLAEASRLERQIRDQVATYAASAERFLAGKANKAQFADVEKLSKQKIEEWKGKIEKIVYGC